MPRSLLIAALLLPPSAVAAGQGVELARARALYNEGAYDAAIETAAIAGKTPALAAAARLVTARARLERFRQTNNPDDLAAARLDLTAVDARALAPRERVEYELGLAEALFLDAAFGAAAELFDSVLARAALIGPDAAEKILDWWASALDREAQKYEPADRRPLYGRILQRMEEQLRADPSCGPASYWLVVAARGLGDLERAWDAAVAGWLRAPLTRDRGAALRADLDRLVREALAPERAHRLSPDRAAAEAAFEAQWQAVKDRWTRP